MAEPRGAAVRARSPASPALYAGAAVVRACRAASLLGALTVAARHRRRDRQRLHLPRAVAAGVEHAVHAGAVQPHGGGCSGRCFAAAVGAGDARVAGAGRGGDGAARSCCWSGAALPPADRRRQRRAARARRGCCRRRSRTHFVARGVLLARRRRRAAARCASRRRPAARGAALLRSRSPAEILGRYLFFVSVVPQAHGGAVSRGSGARRHDAEAAARSRHARRALRLRRRPGGGLRLGAEGARPLGGDDLRLLLGRLRHVHRRQGRHAPSACAATRITR